MLLYLLSRRFRIGIAKIVVLKLGFVLAGVVNAAVPVEESVGSAGAAERAPSSVRQPAEARASLTIPPTIEPSRQTQEVDAASGGGRGLSDLFYQLQVLQQEVQDLRGTVEEQAYQIERMQQDQTDRYRGLDRRISTLSQGGVQGGGMAGSTDSGIDGAPVSAGSATPAAPGERDAYRAAFDAMRTQQYDASLAAFSRLIEDFPNGQYTPNAFYWIGEIHLVASQDAEQARQSFMQVVNLYPDHQKAPDALYKLGVVYSTLGDVDTARQYLARVQAEHPTAPAAELARKYAAELQ